MLGKLLLGLVIVVVVLAVVVATRPSTFHVERSILITASPESVFAQVNDFRSWAAWSPWEKLDPKMEKTFSGPSAGAGAIYAWNSDNRKVGQGRMTIERSDLPSSVSVKLEFIKPFTATNTVTFTMIPVATQTRTTWAMDGHNGFLGKLFHLVMNMDRMVGGDFERGLAALKSVAEAARGPTAAVANAPTPR
jgi:Polyketide cyclase / dehydrase and lipid transport